jgi:hypothetical protein
MKPLHVLGVSGVGLLLALFDHFVTIILVRSIG